MSKTVVITGAAGFIGSHLSQRLLDTGWQVVGIDNFCDFYPRSHKQANLAELADRTGFTLIEADIRHARDIDAAFARHRPQAVIHIAAMAGVRPSIRQPDLYCQVNLDGTVNVLQAAVRHGAQRLLFASSSSVYGNNPKVPFAEDDPVDHPISPYAATKRAGELLCHTWHHLHGLPVFCLRFFTVFGPRQRPDLAINRFLHCLRDGRPIPMFGDGSSSRDYTYIDDILDGITAALERCDRFGIYNLGGSCPVRLDQLIDTCSRVTGIQPVIESQPAQPGDVQRTWADLTRSTADLGYRPRVSLEDGIERQWKWMLQTGR